MTKHAVPDGIDTSRPSPARVYDYLLGGTDNFPADQELAERLLDPETGYPGLSQMARENRKFITGAVTWLAGRDIGQFLDLGAGLPARPAVHETARASVPGARVVYADADAYAVWHSSARLAGVKDVAAVLGDLREPDVILGDDTVRGVLDLAQPLAVILGAVLHFSPADEAAAIVEMYAGALAPGSAVVISTGWYEDAVHERLAALSPMPWYNHSPAVVQGWFEGAGLKLLRDRVADVASWPFMPGGRRRGAAVIGGIGMKLALPGGDSVLTFLDTHRQSSRYRLMLAISETTSTGRGVMTYKWEKLSKAQQNYARRIAEKIKYQVSTSQIAKYLDDFAAWDRDEIDAAELAARTGHKVAA